MFPAQRPEIVLMLRGARALTVWAPASGRGERLGFYNVPGSLLLTRAIIAAS